MKNQDYLTSIGCTGEAALRCLTAMKKYQGNHWWEPDVDPRKLAYYQLKEDIMLCEKFDSFHEAVELLLGRPVSTLEFGTVGTKRLIQEAEQAWKP